MACELCETTGGATIWQDGVCRAVLVEDADYPGFCRVIWNRHIKEMTDLAPTVRQQLMAVVFAVEEAVREVLQPEKINLASLGNMTPHLHWHVIPRYREDKHFPQPIWGVAQRNAQVTLPHDWRKRLTAAIHQKLSKLHADTAARAD